MASCVIVPVPTGETPYYEGAISGLEVGITSKNEAISQFGVPDEVYSRGSELLYIDSVENWKVFIVAFEGGYEKETTRKRHVLLLSFNEKNILTDFKIDAAGDDFGDCSGNGVCFGDSDSFMRYAANTLEAEAKKFAIVDGQCAIYLHGPGNKKAHQVSLNGNIPVNIYSTRAFIHWVTKPGRQSITIWPESTFLDFDCLAGDLAFVHFDYRRFSPSTLKFESHETGQKHISRKRLILLPADK